MCEQASTTSARLASSDAAELLRRMAAVFFACNGPTDTARILDASPRSPAGGPTHVGVAFEVGFESKRVFSVQERDGALEPLHCLECGRPWLVASAERIVVAGRSFVVRFGGRPGIVFLLEDPSDEPLQEITLVSAYP